jgi:hypothetical protein
VLRAGGEQRSTLQAGGGKALRRRGNARRPNQAEAGNAVTRRGAGTEARSGPGRAQPGKETTAARLNNAREEEEGAKPNLIPC